VNQADTSYLRAYEDRDGGIWIRHYGGGLFHAKPDGNTQRISSADGLPGNRVGCWFQDREGDVWVGVDRGGLVRLREKQFQVIGAAEGLPIPATSSVCEDADGNIWLADQGFELCSHTVWHAMLNKFSDAVVQEQIARNVMAIDSAVPNYKVRTMALPYGIWPKNHELAWQGSWTDPKTNQTHTYKMDAVLEVAGGPTRSPFDPEFNAHSVKRIQAVGNDIAKTLDGLDKSKTRFVK
jgi:hypothetical protein